MAPGKGPGKGPAKDTLLIIDTRGVKVTTDNNGEFDDDLDEEEDDPLGSAIQTKYGYYINNFVLKLSKDGKELLLVGMDLRPTFRKDTWAEYDMKERRLNIILLSILCFDFG